MEKRIYQYFGYSDLETFKIDFINEPEKFSELNNVFQKLINHIEIDNIKLNRPSQLEKVVNEYNNLPEKGNTVVFQLDTQLGIIGYKTFKNTKEKDVQEMINYAFSEKTQRTALLTNDGLTNKQLEQFFDRCNDFNIEFMDCFKVNEANHEYFSDRENSIYPLQPHVFLKKGKSTERDMSWKDILTESEKSIIHSKDFTELKHQYVEKQLNDLHIDVDEHKINNLLKLDNQEKIQEHLSVLTYDKHYRINGYRLLTVGSISSTVATPQLMANDLKNEDTKGIIITHCHPSGEPRPSKADIGMTQAMMKIANHMNKEMYDHKVVGFNGVENVANIDEKCYHNKQFCQRGIRDYQRELAKKTNFMYNKDCLEIINSDNIKFEPSLIKTTDKKSYLIHTMKLKDTSGNSDISNNIVKVATPKMNNKQYAEFLKAKPIKQWLADDLLRNLYVKAGNKNLEKYFNFDMQEAEKELEPVAEVLNKKRDNGTNLSI